MMALAPQHTFQVLTKRSARMREYFTNRMRESLIGMEAGAFNLALCGSPVCEWSGLPLPNVRLGVSAEDQPAADERVPDLLDTPAAVRFLSLEPLLGPIDLRDLPAPDGSGARWDALSACGPAGIDQAITGGESGPRARPSSPVWFRSIRDQAEAAGVALLHKQNGEFVSVSEVAGKGRHFKFPDGTTVRRVGKKAAGRLLDGVEHNGEPS
jgi:protein gp37